MQVRNDIDQPDAYKYDQCLLEIEWRQNSESEQGQINTSIIEIDRPLVHMAHQSYAPPRDKGEERPQKVRIFGANFCHGQNDDDECR